MKRVLLATAVAGVLTIGTASAASLGLSGDDAVFASDTVVLADCTVGDVIVTPALPTPGPSTAPIVLLDGFELVSVSPGCEGGHVQLVLYRGSGSVLAVLDGSANVLGPLTVTSDVSFDVNTATGPIIFGEIAGIDVVISGSTP